MIKLSLIIMAFVGFSSISYAEQTTTEKFEVKTNDTKRVIKKGVHRTKEAFCMKGDAECFAQKAKHRAVETKDSVKDKASEIKNKVD